RGGVGALRRPRWPRDPGGPRASHRAGLAGGLSGAAAGSGARKKGAPGPRVPAGAADRGGDGERRARGGADGRATAGGGQGGDAPADAGGAGGRRVAFGRGRGAGGVRADRVSSPVGGACPGGQQSSLWGSAKDTGRGGEDPSQISG